jgi:hypothetical protein
MMITKPAGLADLGQRTCARWAAGGCEAVAEFTLRLAGCVVAVGQRS